MPGTSENNRAARVLAGLNMLVAAFVMASLPPFYRVDLALWACVWAWLITATVLTVHLSARPKK